MRAKLPLTPNLNLNLTRTRPHQPHLPSPPRRLHPLRTLTTTPPHLKKAQKTPPKRTAAVPLHASKTQAQSPTTTSDPFDFSDYSAGIKRAQERLRSELIKIKAGGRSAEEIEGLRVVLGQKGGGGDDGEKKGGENEGEKGRGKGKGEKAGKERVKLRDVASVVARGRNIGVLVGEKDRPKSYWKRVEAVSADMYMLAEQHLKPILSALASLPSLSYTTSPTDPLTLTIAIPPVTAESRLAAKKVADKKGEEALFALKEARGAQKKKHRSMELGRLVVPDELRRAEKEMEKVNERAVGEAKGLVEGCRKGLEGG